MSIIAVDLGGTNLKVGVVDGATVSSVQSVESHSHRGAAAALERLAGVIGGYDLTGVTGIGLALPTLIDSRNARVMVSMKGKFEGLHEIDFQQWSQSKFGRPIKIENDAHAALLGEWKHGAARGGAERRHDYTRHGHRHQHHDRRSVAARQAFAGRQPRRAFCNRPGRLPLRVRGARMRGGAAAPERHVADCRGRQAICGKPAFADKDARLRRYLQVS